MRLLSCLLFGHHFELSNHDHYGGSHVFRCVRGDRVWIPESQGSRPLTKRDTFAPYRIKQHA